MSRFALNYIELKNFRCFEDFRVDFDPHLTVFTATNGHGKTTILEAIKYALSIFVGRFPTKSAMRPSPWDIRLMQGEGRTNWRRADYLAIRTGAEILGTPLEWTVQAQNRSLPKDYKKPVDMTGVKNLQSLVDRIVNMRYGSEMPTSALPLIAYYGTQRAVVTKKIQRRRDFRSKLEYYDGYQGCLNDSLDYKRILEWIDIIDNKQSRHIQERRDFDAKCLEKQVVELVLSKMLPELSDLRVEMNPYRLMVNANVGGNNVACRVDEYLSDGYRIVLMLVLDMVSRILELNPSEFNNPEDVLGCPGLVLIDEVDLHLHPSWQQKIIPDLRKAFPNIQFIVTTHSPQVISTVPRGCIRKLDNWGIVPVEINTEGAQAGQVLSSVFETCERPKETSLAKDIDAYSAMLNDGTWDSEEGVRIWERLQPALQTDPELVSLSIDKLLKENELEASNEASL